MRLSLVLPAELAGITVASVVGELLCDETVREGLANDSFKLLLVVETGFSKLVVETTLAFSEVEVGISFPILTSTPEIFSSALLADAVGVWAISFVDVFSPVKVWAAAERKFPILSPGFKANTIPAWQCDLAFVWAQKNH